LGLLDQVELVRPTQFHSIDDIVRQNDGQPRTRVRPPKRSPHTEPLP
jgi:hypothetical protein